MITPVHYILLSVLLFTIGLVILVTRRQHDIRIAGTQLLFQSALLALAALTSWFEDWNGEIAALVVIALGATVGSMLVAIGLVSDPDRSGTSEQHPGLTAHRPGPPDASRGPGEDRAYL